MMPLQYDRNVPAMVWTWIRPMQVLLVSGVGCRGAFCHPNAVNLWSAMLRCESDLECGILGQWGGKHDH